MGTIERLNARSQKGRRKLNKQTARVQEEARKLRAQVRRLRRAEQAATKQRKKLGEQMAQSGRVLGQRMLQHGGELTAAAGTQLKAGRQMVLERGSNLFQNANQRGSRTMKHLAGWRDDASARVRKQQRSLGQQVSNWKDDTTYVLRQQGQNVLQNIEDWGDDTMYALRKQGQHLKQNIAERRDDTAHILRKQGRHLSRGATRRKDDVVYQLRKQGKLLTRATEKSERKFWPILGFLLGVLFAGGVTYWLVKREFGRRGLEEEQIELQPINTLGGTFGYPGEEIRYTSQGGAAVVTRPATSAEPLSRFVGVLSTREYYPIEQQPDAHDLVFFASEADARAEGFTAAPWQ